MCLFENSGQLQVSLYDFSLYISNSKLMNFNKINSDDAVMVG